MSRVTFVREDCPFTFLILLFLSLHLYLVNGSGTVAFPCCWAPSPKRLFFFSCSVLEAVYPRKGIMPETLLLGFSPSQFYGVDLKSSKAPCA